jgi:hypothetical protein
MVFGARVEAFFTRVWWCEGDLIGIRGDGHPPTLPRMCWCSTIRRWRRGSGRGFGRSLRTRSEPTDYTKSQKCLGIWYNTLRLPRDIAN